MLRAVSTAAVRICRQGGGGGFSVKTVIQKAGFPKGKLLQEDGKGDGKSETEPEVCLIHTIIHC